MNILGEKLNIHKKFFSKIGVNYLVLGAIALISQMIIFNILNVINPEYISNINIISAISSICVYIIPFPIFYWLMKKLDAFKIEKRSVDAKTFLIYISVTLTLMWIGNIIGTIITMLLSGAIQTEIANPVYELINNSDIWFNLLVISILGPIFEEILFRKMLIDRTIKYGAKVSIILSAVLFGFFHGNINQFFYAFLMGGFLAYVYIRTGKIIYPIILHAIVNMMGSVVSLIVVNSFMALQTSFNPLDAFILIVYLIILFVILLIGVYELIHYKKAKFNGEKTAINLKNPLKTMLLNYGMVLFILFCIFEMVYQIVG